MGDFTGAGVGYALRVSPMLALSVGGRTIAVDTLDWSDAKARKAQAKVEKDKKIAEQEWFRNHDH